MASTSISTSPGPSVTQLTPPKNSGPNTAVIVGVAVGVGAVVVIAGVVVFLVLRRRHFRRGGVQSRHQDTYQHTNDSRPPIFYVTVGLDKPRVSSLFLDDQKHEKQKFHHSIQRYAAYPHENNEKAHSAVEGQEYVDEDSVSLTAPHPPGIILPQLFIPEFKPISVTEVLNASARASPTDPCADPNHVSATSSATGQSPASLYSQASPITEPVPPIPDRFKSVATNDTNMITRANTRAIGLMLKQRAKGYDTIASSHSLSPVSPIERSGSIRPAFDEPDLDDEKPPMRIRIAQERKKALASRMEPLLEVPDSAVSASTTSRFPVIPRDFPAHPAPPTPTLLTESSSSPSDEEASLLQTSRRSLLPDGVPQTHVSPLRISKPRPHRDGLDIGENVPWGGKGVYLRDKSAEKELDVCHLNTRFRSTHGEVGLSSFVASVDLDHRN